MVQQQDESSLEQIEYLLYQSTQGFHFMFDHEEIVKVMSRPTEERDFFTLKNMEKVQGMLTKFLERPTMSEKRTFLESLNADDHELLIRAYFHLVENTILANTDIRH